MSGKRSFKLRWNFLVTWVFMSGLGLAMGLTVRQLFLGMLLALFPGIFGKIVIGAIIGVSLGFAQNLVLPQRVRYKSGWLVASSVGWAIGWGLGWRIGFAGLDTLGFRVVFIVMGVVAGLSTGLGQWYFLRRQFDGAWWWVPVNTAGWGLGMATTLFISGVLSWYIAGVVYGLVTAPFLMWLWRNHFSWGSHPAGQTD